MERRAQAAFRTLDTMNPVDTRGHSEKAPAVPESLVLCNGSVLDTRNRVFRNADVWIDRGVIRQIGPRLNVPNVAALDAAGLWITPGLFDTHTHLMEGFSVWGIAGEKIGWRTGVTTLVDAGSAGSTTWPGFRKHFVDAAETRVFALLNISTIGMLTGVFSGVKVGELLSPRYFDVGHAEEVIQANRDCIVGVKVRLSLGVAGDAELENLAFERARELADRVRLPLMVHHSQSSISTEETLEHLNAGDIYTHSFHAHEGGILDPGGSLLPAVFQARERGVLFDVGHGAGAFSWKVARACAREGFWPDLLGTDLHRYSLAGPIPNMANLLTKFLHLGMAPGDLFRAASSDAWKALSPAGERYPSLLEPGAEAELSLWALREGTRRLQDTDNVSEEARSFVEPVGVYFKGAYRALQPDQGESR